MPQIKVGDLKRAIANIPDDHDVFIRAVSNPCGNIVEAGKAKPDTYSFFGKSIPCVIIEPITSEDESNG